MPVAKIGRGAIDCLTSLRFVAALAIVLFHIQPVMTRFVKPGPAPLYDVLGQLACGVQFFFVLSGFILFYNYGERQRLDLREFYVKRLVRIYPLHLVTLAVWCGLYLASWPPSPGARLASGLANVSLTHALLPGALFALGYNSVSWSLSNEAFFYAWFPVVRQARVAMAVVASVTVLLLALHVGHWDVQLQRYFPNFEYFFPLVRICDFCAGILVARMFSPLARLEHATFLEALALATVAIQVIVVTIPYNLAQVARLFVFSWTIWVFAHQQGRISQFLARQRALVLLGEASFSLYMWHHLVMCLCNQRLPASTKPWLAVTVAVTLALGASLASYKLVEDPMRRLLTRRLLPQESRRPKTISAPQVAPNTPDYRAAA